MRWGIFPRCPPYRSREFAGKHFRARDHHSAAASRGRAKVAPNSRNPAFQLADQHDPSYPVVGACCGSTVPATACAKVSNAATGQVAKSNKICQRLLASHSLRGRSLLPRSRCICTIHLHAVASVRACLLLALVYAAKQVGCATAPRLLHTDPTCCAPMACAFSIHMQCTAWWL